MDKQKQPIKPLYDLSKYPVGAEFTMRGEGFHPEQKVIVASHDHPHDDVVMCTKKGKKIQIPVSVCNLH